MPPAHDSSTSRRDLLKGAAGVALGAGAGKVGGIRWGSSMEPGSTFLNLIRPPDVVLAFGPDHTPIPLDRSRDGHWAGGGVEIETVAQADHLALTLRGNGVCQIQIRWHGDLRLIRRYLGDHWERSYADLEWRGEAPNRVMPWYFMAFDGQATHGYGVRTNPRAMVFWNADSEGISLWADVRNGGGPVELGDRTLDVAEIVCRPGAGHENPYAATHAFCRQMCPSPRLPGRPIYGTNDWNYAYGNNNAELIATVSGIVSELSPDSENRPYSVIDDGWWDKRWHGNEKFGDMAAFASRLKGLGVHPGLWYRALEALPDAPDTWRLARDREFLDPTIPEVRDSIAGHMQRFVAWGYEMVKHDYTSFDLFGQWGFQMGPSVTRDGWHFHDRSKTNAEVVADLYAVLRAVAGSARLIGCNTFSHLSAGVFEVQRIGDDTSGRSWNRNRRMGVNTLAFRVAQNDAFYVADPDIVAITHNVSWELVDQWLRLVSQSGAALFVAADPSIVEAKHRTALREALTVAAKPQPTGEPLDWLETECPRRWRLRGQEVEFAWMSPTGAWPFAD